VTFNADDWRVNEIRVAEIRSKVDVPGFTLALEESEDIVLADGALDVTDDCAGSIVHELDTDLGDTTARASPSKDLEMQW